MSKAASPATLPKALLLNAAVRSIGTDYGKVSMSIPMIMFHKTKIEVPRCRFSEYAQSMSPHERLGGPTAKLQDELMPLCVVTCSVEAMNCSLEEI